MQMQQPTTIIVQGGQGNCPGCHVGNLIIKPKFTIWTCIVCWCFPCGLCCDCSWGQGQCCLSCGYQSAAVGGGPGGVNLQVNAKF